MVAEMYKKIRRLYCINDISHNRFIKKGCFTKIEYDQTFDEYENRVEFIEKDVWRETNEVGELMDVDIIGDGVYTVCQICSGTYFQFYYFRSSEGGEMLKDLLQKYLPRKDEPIVKEFISNLVDYAKYTDKTLDIPFRKSPNFYGTLFSDFGIKIETSWFTNY